MGWVEECLSTVGRDPSSETIYRGSSVHSLGEEITSCSVLFWSVNQGFYTNLSKIFILDLEPSDWFLGRFLLQIL